jgi:hypothetical protein
MAGAQGVEPCLSGLESLVLPIYDAPKMVPGGGIEPPSVGSEPTVIPLNEPGMVGAQGIEPRLSETTGLQPAKRPSLTTPLALPARVELALNDS